MSTGLQDMPSCSGQRGDHRSEAGSQIDTWTIQFVSDHLLYPLLSF